MKLRSLLFLVGPSFILGALVMSLVLINYDLLGWENTELYKSVKQYGIDNYSYVEDVHDCSEISQEMAQITEDLGFNAKLTLSTNNSGGSTRTFDKIGLHLSRNSRRLWDTNDNPLLLCQRA